MLKTQWLNITFFFFFTAPDFYHTLSNTFCLSINDNSATSYRLLVTFHYKSPSQLKTPISYPVKISSLLSPSTGWTVALGAPSRDGTQSASHLLHLSVLQNLTIRWVWAMRRDQVKPLWVVFCASRSNTDKVLASTV